MMANQEQPGKKLVSFWVILIFVIGAFISFFLLLCYLTTWTTIRAKQDEAKSSLLQINQKQVEYRSKYGTYGKTFKEIGWEPKGSIRYCYQAGSDTIQPASLSCCEFPASDPPFVEKDKFRIIASGPVDNDTTTDVWSIDEKKNLKNLVDDFWK